MKIIIITIFISIITVACNEKSTKSIYKNPSKSYIDYIFPPKADSLLCDLFNHLEGDYYIYINNIRSGADKFYLGNTDTVWDLLFIEEYNPRDKYAITNEQKKLVPNHLNDFLARTTNRYAVICNNHVIPVTFYFDRKYTYYGNREGLRSSLNPVRITGNEKNSYLIVLGKYLTNTFLIKNWHFKNIDGKKVLIDYKYSDERLHLINDSEFSLIVWTNPKNYGDKGFSLPRSRMIIPPYDTSILSLRSNRWEEILENNDYKVLHTNASLFDSSDYVNKYLVDTLIFDYDFIIKNNWHIHLSRAKR